MSKKIKSRKPKTKPKKLCVRSISFKQRKRIITDTMEAIVANTPLAQQHEIVEHICDIGIDLLGLVTGLDSRNAIVTFPDDGIVRLLHMIQKQEQETQVPCETIIENLIEQLAKQAPPAAYN